MREKDVKNNIIWGIRAILFLLIVSFFLPLYGMSFLGYEVKMTGMQFMFEIEVPWGRTDGYPLLGLLAVLPVIMLLCTFFVENIRGLTIFNIVIAFVDIITLVIFNSKLAESLEELSFLAYLVSADLMFGYYAEMILNIFLIVLSAVLLRNEYLTYGRVAEPLTEDEMAKRGIIFISIYSASIVILILVILAI